MQHLEVSAAVRPVKWSLGVKWLSNFNINIVFYLKFTGCETTSLW